MGEIKQIFKELNGENTVDARYPNLEELLGYIHYLEDKGTINFGAQSSRESPKLGATSKRDKKHVAGTHGKGFKVAAL